MPIHCYLCRVCKTPYYTKEKAADCENLHTDLSKVEVIEANYKVVAEDTHEYSIIVLRKFPSKLKLLFPKSPGEVKHDDPDIPNTGEYKLIKWGIRNI